MDPTNTVTPSHLLETARVIPIAELCPDLVEPSAKAVGGVVTITWPYNKVKGTFAFNLAEPDFRLRRNKGQVRIDFTGRAAKAVGDCGLGGNDEVLLSLNGAAWEAEAINKRRSLPGADLGWRLVFSESMALRIKRAETSETDLVVVNEQPDEHETAPDSTPIQPLAITKSPSPPAPPSPTHLASPVRKINTQKFGDSEFASPAFVRRARMSYGSLFEDGFDIFQDDGGVEGKGRKRTRFGRDSSAWRYISQSLSPELVAESLENVDEQVSSPTGAVSSPTKAQMADEGCQTMELDQSSPRPIGTPPQTYVMVPEDVPLSDAPADTPMDSATDQKIRTSPLKGWFSKSTAQNAPTPNSNEAPPPDMGAPPPHPDQQQPSFSGYSFAGNPWTMSMAPSAFEPQQKAPLPTHVDESFVSSGFGPIKSGKLSIPFDKPDSPGQTYPVDGEDQEPFNDGVIHSAELNASTIDYSPLEPTEDTHPQPIHDEALTNYPAIYLESDHMSQNDQIMTEQASRYPAVAELASSSWTTVNDNSKATAKAPTDRLRSRDGDTPEQAVVIDESDAESDSELEPMAVEDTVHNSRAYTLGMYEDAEAEDEADAQYSDDDEPEYNADEMSSDYDTRNYQQPGDDTDGSLDEDLRPQPLEPEFDDGESWDEEEQEEFLDEENEGEYEMDEDVAEPAPQPAVRANPTVIDLISSSEDEGEDEDEGDSDGDGDDVMPEIERSGGHIDSRTSPNRQQITLEGDPQQVHLNGEESEIVSQVSMSEAENSSEAGGEPHEYASSYEEEEGEYEDENEEEEDDDDDGGESERDNQEEAIGDELELESCKGEKDQERESSQNQAQQHTELEIKSMPEAGPKGDALLGDMHNHADISYRQTEPKRGSHESIGIETRTQILEEGSAIIPLSAADGLEMLSRAVDKESNACSRGVLAESAVERVVVETTSEQSPPELAEEGSAQMQDASSYHQNLILEGVPDELPPHNEKTGQVDPTASSNPNTSHPSPIINKKELTTAAPSSPPLTQSFRSLIEDNPFTIEETAVTLAAQTTTTQLPTPLNTQITDITLNASTSTYMNIAESFESYTTIEQPDFEPREGSDFGKLADDLAQQDSNTNTGQGNFEQQRDSTPIMELQAQQPSSESSIASSPALSFQTQVDDVELTLPNTVEQPNDDSQFHRRSSSEHGSGASDTSRSFTSHMEIDEELQASILDNSYLDHDVRDENDDESVQIDTSEAYVESEQPNQANIVPSLHEDTPAKQLAEEMSAQLKRNFVENSRSSGEESDTSIQNDPSVHLARVANASRRGKKRAASTDLHRPRKRPFDTRRSPTPETDDSSIQFTRTSLASQTPRSDEDSYSMTAAKLQLARHLRDELPDCTSLKVLRQHLTKSLDVIAVAVMKPPDAQRAKGGPREFMMSFTISDYSIGPYAVAEALIYRPHRDTLPVIKYGDIVLLRNFTVVSLANKGFGLRTNEESSWAVFDYEGEPAQIKGPPVEYSERETLYVDYLREWFRLLDIKAREKLEVANQKIINAGKSK